MVASSAPPNSRVVLLGSHARGNADADADFDVLVIEPTVRDAIQEAVRLRSELDELDVPVDLIVMDEAKAEQRAVEDDCLSSPQRRPDASGRRI
jgi:predicted nucleotidyltransferase